MRPYMLKIGKCYHKEKEISYIESYRNTSMLHTTQLVKFSHNEEIHSLHEQGIVICFFLSFFLLLFFFNHNVPEHKSNYPTIITDVY